MSTTAAMSLTDQQTELLREVGYDDGRAGTSLLVDQRVVATESPHPDVEVLPIGQALKTYDWLQDLMFGLIDPDEDEHVQQAAELLNDPVGHFVRVREGAVVTSPIQLFSILETPQGRQFTHNVTVIEAGADVEMIAGSAVPPSVHAGHHISIDECYVREGASCRSVSIEHWGANMESHGYARTHIGAWASATTTTLQLAPIRHHVSNAVTWVDRGGRNNDQAVMLAPAGTERVVTSAVHLVGDGAGSESVTRLVSDGGVIVNHATLLGEAADTHGFVGC
ncbi:MAG: SufD family Fe-S cluster assembly protein, partial [Actinomycetota bacterium]